MVGESAEQIDWDMRDAVPDHAGPEERGWPLAKHIDGRFCQRIANGSQEYS